MGGKVRQNREWWTTEVASALREKKEALKVIEKVDEGVLHLYGQKTKQQRKLLTGPRMTWKQSFTLN